MTYDTDYLATCPAGYHDGVMTCKCFLQYWPFVRGIHDIQYNGKLIEKNPHKLWYKLEIHAVHGINLSAYL